MKDGSGDRLRIKRMQIFKRAAAEMAVPLKMELNRRCSELKSMLNSNINKYINEIQLKLNVISEKLTDPRKKIQDLHLNIDDLTARLNRRISAFFNTKQEHLGWWMDRLTANQPIGQLIKLNEKLDNLLNIMLKSYEIYYNFNRSKLRELIAKLHALSPMEILSRGYSITRTIPQARIVKDSDRVALNQEVELILAKGRLICHVRRKFTDG
jgi:exodeoxyribonuclease VII large subunit